MYIPEFWCGVVATVLVEVGGLVVALIAAGIKGKNNKK